MAYSDVLKTLRRSSYLGFTTRNFSLVSSQISNHTAKWMQAFMGFTGNCYKQMSIGSLIDISFWVFSILVESESEFRYQ
ncbi:hypothetical protein Gorai_003267, partial [Gossypium raimondii]|nr:hypothetical protein [Gossypium raimondii]